MADFAHLMAAAESSLGWEPRAFEAAYTANRHASDDAVFESDPVAVAIDKLIRNRTGGRSWEGTATMLLGELNELVPEDVRRSRFWPGKHPAGHDPAGVGRPRGAAAAATWNRRAQAQHRHAAADHADTDCRR